MLACFQNHRFLISSDNNSLFATKCNWLLYKNKKPSVMKVHFVNSFDFVSLASYANYYTFYAKNIFPLYHCCLKASCFGFFGLQYAASVSANNTLSTEARQCITSNLFDFPSVGVEAGFPLYPSPTLDPRAVMQIVSSRTTETAQFSFISLCICIFN